MRATFFYSGACNHNRWKFFWLFLLPVFPFEEVQTSSGFEKSPEGFERKKVGNYNSIGNREDTNFFGEDREFGTVRFKKALL